MNWRHAWWPAGAAVAVALAAGIATAGGAAPALPPALVQLGAVDGRVLRVTVTPEGGAGGWSEAVAPSSGQCRRELPGSVTIAGRRTWALTDEHGTTVRTGSRAFLGRLLDVCYSLAPIGRAIATGRPISAGSEVSLSRAGVRGTAQVEEELSGDAARALFAVPLDVVESWAVERRLGTRPWQPIRAYWLGRGFGRWKAETSVEAFYAEQQATLHDVYYRAGRRELEVISRPRAQAAARSPSSAHWDACTAGRGTSSSSRAASGRPSTPTSVRDDRRSRASRW